jgi:hypothetical protein
MKAKIQTPKFEELLADYAKKIDDINAAARECVEAGQEIQYQAMKQGLERHKKTGAALKALVKDPIVQEGNTVSTRTGTDIKANEKGFFDGNWQEFGVKPLPSGGKPRFLKDPWFRPAIDSTKGKIRSQWKVIIKRRAGIDTK